MLQGSHGEVLGHENTYTCSGGELVGEGVLDGYQGGDDGGRYGRQEGTLAVLTFTAAFLTLLLFFVAVPEVDRNMKDEPTLDSTGRPYAVEGGLEGRLKK